MENKFLLVILFVGLFLIPNILALGITPGRTTMDFSANVESLNSVVKFNVVNTDKKDLK